MNNKEPKPASFITALCIHLALSMVLATPLVVVGVIVYVLVLR